MILSTTPLLRRVLFLVSFLVSFFVFSSMFSFTKTKPKKPFFPCIPYFFFFGGLILEVLIVPTITI